VNATTAATLATIFPVIILALVLERERVSLKLRRKRRFRDLGLVTISASILGMVLALVWSATDATVTDAWSLGCAIAVWTMATIAFAGFTVNVLAIVATSELREDEEID
jgi:hypothetical protein